MKYRKNDILIKIMMHGHENCIDPKYFIQVFDSIENALYSSDRKDIQLASKKFEHITDVHR